MQNQHSVARRHFVRPKHWNQFRCLLFLCCRERCLPPPARKHSLARRSVGLQASDPQSASGSKIQQHKRVPGSNCQHASSNKLPELLWGRNPSAVISCCLRRRVSSAFRVTVVLLFASVLTCPVFQGSSSDRAHLHEAVDRYKAPCTPQA